MAKEKKGKETKEPEINFDEISEELASIEQKQHIDQIEAALTDVYLQNAKYTDEKGVVRFKKKFTKEEGKKVGNELYDALAYHAHRRVFGFTEDQYRALSGIKDSNGMRYTDAVTQYHFKGMDRKGLVKTLSKDDENEFDHKTLQEILKKPIGEHAELLTRGIISKRGLDEPEHMEKVKGAIDKIVEKYHLPKTRFDTKKMYTPDQVLQTYVALSNELYSSERLGKKKAA